MSGFLARQAVGYARRRGAFSRHPRATPYNQYAAPSPRAVKETRRSGTRGYGYGYPRYGYQRSYQSVPYQRQRSYGGYARYPRQSYYSRRPAVVQQVVPQMVQQVVPQPAPTVAVAPRAYVPSRRRYQRRIPRRYAFSRVYMAAMNAPRAYRTAVRRHARDWDAMRRQLGIKHAEDPMELPSRLHPGDRYRTRHELIPAFSEVICDELDRMQNPQIAMPVEQVPVMPVQSLPVGGAVVV